jgi:hypothetical protein
VPHLILLGVEELYMITFFLSQYGVIKEKHIVLLEQENKIVLFFFLNISALELWRLVLEECHSVSFPNTDAHSFTSLLCSASPVLFYKVLLCNGLNAFAKSLTKK